MKRLLNVLLLLPAFLALVACATSQPAAGPGATAPDTTRQNAKSAASLPPEDLSKYRPKFAPAAPARAAASTPKPYVAPTNHVNAQIDQRLRDQAVANLNVKYTNGYRILVYIGLERDQAMAVRRTIISRYPQETDYITFKQPVYRLWIGDYTTKLEAEQAMLRLRPLAPKAELQATQVLVNKTRF